jgi:hypothetical protein
MSGRQPLVEAYVNGAAYRFDIADELRPSYFGGPLDLQIRGQVHGPHPLHRIANISSVDLPELREKHIWDVPLIYGMRYDGCSLSYRLRIGSEIELAALDPAVSSDDFPYPDYPALLPYFPLRLAEHVECPWEQFAEWIPNAPSAPPTDIYVAVPPPATVGCSLWGQIGDAEGVVIVWEIDASTKEVRAYNRCT